MTSSPIPSSARSKGATDDGAHGGSASSSSSSIYHHPFSSFNFDAFHEQAEAEKAKGDPSTRYRPNNMSYSPKDQQHHFAAASADDGPSSSNVPASPATSYAESAHSMDEYEMDSPSSLSSWNSFMSGHRGDLADVEDLELGEPELETVSEVDEDGNAPLPHRFGQESEDDDARHEQRRQQSKSFGDILARRRTVTSNSHAHAPSHSPTTPSFSHFSPRTGGHGLSHHSRWTSRTPASLAARRRKGRIAELAEEGGGTEAHGIHSTNLGAAVAANDRSNSSSGSSSPTSLLAPQQSQRCEHPYPGTPPSTTWQEFTGPPAPPIRPISPSETVPAVPSPLCECISAEAQAAADQVTPTSSTIKSQTQSEQSPPSSSRPQSSSPLPAPMPRRGVFDSATHQDLTRKESTSPSSPSSAHTTRTTASSSATDGVPAPSSPDTTPPSSPVQELSRKPSLARARRASSPPRPHHNKVPLRPCFSRRNSTQTGSSSASEHEGNGSSPRGRCHVRFSPAPPQTIRTHSPVEYDRTSYPINNRLSLKDVEELQKLDMDMGLLSAKCAAIAAITSCKLPNSPKNKSLSEPASPAEPSDAIAVIAPPAGRLDMSGSTDESGRPRRDSTGGFAHHIGGGIAAGKREEAAGTSSHNGTAGNTAANQVSPADFLRAQREKERERACRMAGIGTGLGGRNLGKGVRGQATNPIIARFGLSAPPPLPGCAASTSTSSSSSSSLGPTKDWFQQAEERRGRKEAEDEGRADPSAAADLTDHDRTLSPPVYRSSRASAGSSSSMGGRASSLHRTDSEERALSRTRLVQCGSSSDLSADRERDRGRPRGTARSPQPSSLSTPTVAAPALTHTSPSPPGSPPLTPFSPGDCLVTMQDPYDPYPSPSPSTPSSPSYYHRLGSASSSPMTTPTNSGGEESLTPAASAASATSAATSTSTPSSGSASSASSPPLLSTSPMTPLASSASGSLKSRLKSKPSQLSPPQGRAAAASGRDTALLSPSSATASSKATKTVSSTPGYFDWRPTPSSGGSGGKPRSSATGPPSSSSRTLSRSGSGRGSSRPGCGYDSPGSAYESGSEFDLLSG